MELELKNTNIDIRDNKQMEKSSIVANLCKLSCPIPNSLLESRLWKNIRSNSKEVYLILAANYDYKDGLSKVTHTMIQDASGIKSRPTLVEALNVLKEAELIHVVEIGTKNKKIISHNYLMPYQEEIYANMLGVEPRDFSHYNPVIYSKKPNKKKKSISNIDPLFFRACLKLSRLGMEEPNKLLEEYFDDTQSLRTIIFLCDCAYVIKKHELIPNSNSYDMLVEFIANSNITPNVFGDEITEEVRTILKKEKEKNKTNK